MEIIVTNKIINPKMGTVIIAKAHNLIICCDILIFLGYVEGKY